MPEPLTPADCDLRGFGFMPLDVVRLADSDLIALSTGEEFKAAVLLWCKAWLQVPAASLPDDDKVLARLSGTGRGWQRVRAMALRGFVPCDDGRLYHPVIAEKARDAWARRCDYLEQRERDRDRMREWRQRKRETGPVVTRDDRVTEAEPNANVTAKTETKRGTSLPFPDVNGLPDPEKLMFDGGRRLLRAAGIPADKAGSLLGKWKRDHGAAAVIAALGKAQREGAIEPVAFIEGCLRAQRRGADHDPDRITV